MTVRLRVQPAGTVPIFAQIVQQVREAVARGRLRTGEQMPTVRDLAADLLVNPNTVAKAYQELERSGVFVTRRGAGTFVAEPSCRLVREERDRILDGKILSCLTEAVHLEIPKKSVRHRFDESIEKFQWPEE